MNISRTSVKSLLGMAIKAEIEADKIYVRLASRVKNPFLKEKFKTLAFEEKKHKKILENLFASMFKGEKPSIPRSVDATLLPSVRMKPSSSLAEILYQAMASEQAAQNFYAAIAGRLKSEKKRILEYLSKVEKSHYLMLRSEYILALEYEDYAEKDIDKVIS
ncbi:MAG: ferritin family protein [Candidatus Aminicenantales bacterium]